MTTGSNRRREQGLSLVELLVSVTILAVAATIALVLYDGARQSFKLGENVAEQQQAVRIAFDLISSDIRMAGFNTNPDGSKTRPDEQIEAVYDTAIVVRADFDARDPIDSRDPEDALAGPGGAFLSVSTGNDEIRAYVLAKPGGASTDTLTFFADVGEPVRNGSVETVDLTNISLVHDDPPYTLYRVTLDENAAPARTVLIENVRSMAFRYYDGAGNAIAAVGGSDGPADVSARAAIRRVGVEIEALTRDPDLKWVDAEDSNPLTRAFRKFKLKGDITPRNLGMLGIKDFMSDSLPPSMPGNPQLFAGHCGGLNISWPANPPEDETAYYRISYGTDPANLADRRISDTTDYYLGGLLHDTEYYVAIQALDAAGNQSASSSVSNRTTENTNTPVTPPGLAASTGPVGTIDLNWTAVSENTANTPGDPQSPLLRELAGYRVYRAETHRFHPSEANRIADEGDLPVLPAPAIVDDNVVNCRWYHYKVTAVDSCGIESEPTNPATARSFSAIRPLPPAEVGAFYHLLGWRRVLWSPVREDVDGNLIHIDEYVIFRAGPMVRGIEPEMPGDFSYVARIEGRNEYQDHTSVPQGQTVWYAVMAVDDCVNESELSEPATPDCAFPGAVVIRSPEYGTILWGETEVTVAVERGYTRYEEARLYITDEDTGEEFVYTQPGPGPVWTFPWNAHPNGGFKQARHNVRAEVDTQILSRTCTASTSIMVSLAP
jgi:prepilin-type N-terminal cleavage/methylation domain-containing protein